MAFGRWYPLEEAAENAPAGPGVMQVRLASGLIDYPTGKSAMIHYEAAADLPHAAAELALAHPGREWLCRFADAAPGTGAVPGADAMLTELLTLFRRRFGAPPALPD
jgi:hypothetical protein